LNIGLSHIQPPRVNQGSVINIPQDISKVNCHLSLTSLGSGRKTGVQACEKALPVYPASLLYLYSNNCIENAQKGSQAKSSDLEKIDAITALTSLLSPYHKKSAQTLFLNVQRLIEKEAQSVDHVGFLTLTFPDSVTCNKEASRRFHSFQTNYLAKHEAFGKWVNQKERQKGRGRKEGNAGAWHYHLVITLNGDIRSGVNWEELAKGNYRSASPYLRSIWKDLRDNLEKYGFGRSELLPIRTNAEMMARYIGKYVSKHIGQREENDKGVRLTSYSGDWVKNSVKFAWNTQNAHEWRRKLAKFAKSLGCSELYQLSEKLGPGWVYKYLEDIIAIDQTILERLVNDRAEGFTSHVPEFESNTVKKTVQNQKAKLKAEKENKVSETDRRAAEKKKRETKNYMKQLSSEYTDKWVSESNVCNSLETVLQETKEALENLHMKKRCHAIEKYRDQQSIFILKTGEVVPF